MGGGGVPMSHVDYKKGQCRPVEFKKHPCRMSLRPKKGCVALSILGVYTQFLGHFNVLHIVIRFECRPKFAQTSNLMHS